MNGNGNGRVTVSEQRLADALALERKISKIEHLRTRFWVLFVTAPAWGSLVADAMGNTQGLAAGGISAAIGLVGIALTRH